MNAQTSPTSKLNSTLRMVIDIYQDILWKGVNESTSLEYKIYCRERLIEVQVLIESLKDELGMVTVIH